MESRSGWSDDEICESLLQWGSNISTEPVTEGRNPYLLYIMQYIEAIFGAKIGLNRPCSPIAIRPNRGTGALTVCKHQATSDVERMYIRRIVALTTHSLYTSVESVRWFYILWRPDKSESPGGPGRPPRTSKFFCSRTLNRRPHAETPHASDIPCVNTSDPPSSDVDIAAYFSDWAAKHRDLAHSLSE
jgi:hypothetical protein